MTAAECHDLAALKGRSEIAHIAQHVYLANYFAAKSRSKLAAAGISHILVCAGELPQALASDRGLTYLSLSGLADNPSAQLPLTEALAFIDSAREADGHVLCHCAAGGSRSASVVIGWLMREQRLAYEEALAKVRERRFVQPNLGFEEQLRAWEKTCAAAQALAPSGAATATPSSSSEDPPSSVIFLDCDGVLANARSQTGDFDDDDPSLAHHPTGALAPLERRCLAELRRVVEATGAAVVLSTSWRLDREMRAYLVSHLAPFARVAGDTPDGADRGAEVRAWLAAAGPSVRSFVIVDDGHEPAFARAGLSAHLVQTVMRLEPDEPAAEGLTAAKADEAMAILARPVLGPVPGPDGVQVRAIRVRRYGT